MNFKKLLNKKFIFFVLILFIIVIVYSVFFYEEKEYHTHADFKVYVNSSFINFSIDKYQSTQVKTHHPFVHLHDNNGEVIHHHDKGLTLGMFFDSFNMSLTEGCFIDEYNNSYCTNETYEFNVYVNDKEIKKPQDYIFEDLDRVLIVHTNKGGSLNYLFDQVSDKACIESAICPERGSPSEGTCVTGQACAVSFEDFE